MPSIDVSLGFDGDWRPIITVTGADNRDIPNSKLPSGGIRVGGKKTLTKFSDPSECVYRGYETIGSREAFEESLLHPKRPTIKDLLEARYKEGFLRERGMAFAPKSNIFNGGTGMTPDNIALEAASADAASIQQIKQENAALKESIRISGKPGMTIPSIIAAQWFEAEAEAEGEGDE